MRMRQSSTGCRSPRRSQARLRSLQRQRWRARMRCCARSRRAASASSVSPPAPPPPLRAYTSGASLKHSTRVGPSACTPTYTYLHGAGGTSYRLATT